MVYGLFIGGYALVNDRIAIETAADWAIPLDRWWPFVPAMVWPFLLEYVLLLVPALVARSRRRLVELAVAFALLVALSCLLFLLFPVRVTRPALLPDTLSGRLLAWLYLNDRPVCAFPSLHVSAVVLATLALFRERTRWGWLFLPFALATALSTLFVKQHVLADVAGGVALGLAVDAAVLGLGARLLRGLRTAYVLARLPSSRPPGVGERRCTTVGGAEYDLYEPSRPERALLLVHGMNVLGERDQRLVAFARAFAREGFRVAAPALRGLKTFRGDLGDASAIIEAAEAVRLPGGGLVPVAGFSFGGGLSLVAASRPEARGLLGPLVVFGAYHDVEDVWRRQTDRPPERDEAWSEFVYAQLLLALLPDSGAFRDDGERREAVALLADYCAGGDVGPKRAFWERTLRGRAVAERHVATLDAALLAAISPAGKLGEVAAKVYVVHDAQDGLVPAEHGRRIHAELAARRATPGQQLLVSPVVSHVSLKDAWRLRDVARLIDILGALWGEPA